MKRLAQNNYFAEVQYQLTGFSMTAFPFMLLNDPSHVFQVKVKCPCFCVPAHFSPQVIVPVSVTL